MSHTATARVSFGNLSQQDAVDDDSTEQSMALVPAAPAAKVAKTKQAAKPKAGAAPAVPAKKVCVCGFCGKKSKDSREKAKKPSFDQLITIYLWLCLFEDIYSDPLCPPTVTMMGFPTSTWESLCLHKST